MEKPLVSVIIPTYNRAHLIGETLDSIIAQTYTNWECIVVDDGSTDNTDEVMDRYCTKDQRIQYHHRPKNRPKGGNACRNYGFELSKGEYVNWFDDDDLMFPKKIEIQIEQIHNTKYDFAVCQTIMYDKKLMRKIGLRANKLKSDNIFEDYILSRIFWLTGAPLWKKEFLKFNNLHFDEYLYQAQDYDFHMRVLNISKNYYSYENTLVQVNSHESNMSNSTTDKPSKILSNVRVKFKIIKNYNKELSYNIILNKYKELLALYKLSLKKKYFKIAIFILKYLVITTKCLKINYFNKLKYSIKFMVAFMTFLFFSKGEILLKFEVGKN